MRSYSFNANLHERRNFDGANLIRSAQLGGKFLFVNYWNLSASTQVDIGEYDDRETRGNGLYRKPTSYSGFLSFSTDSREPISVDFSPEFSLDSRNKKAFGAELGVEIRPVTWMEWEVETAYERVNRQESWVENIEENGLVASIFGDRTTEELDFRVYGSVTFTRDLTLQFYTQIFLAKGHYTDFRQLQGTLEFVPYAYTGSPDFNDQSLNINLVLRWEYLPGSTLFFVWSHARIGGNENYFTTIKDDLHDTFHIPPSNVLLLKASYWWNL